MREAALRFRVMPFKKKSAAHVPRGRAAIPSTFVYGQSKGREVIRGPF